MTKAKVTMQDKIDARALEMLNALLSNCDLHQIVTFDKARGIIYIGGQMADQATLNNLKSEAEFLFNSHLWKILYESPKELAQRAMFVDSESVDGLKKGRSILYTLDTQKKILDTLRAVIVK